MSKKFPPAKDEEEEAKPAPGFGVAAKKKPAPMPAAKEEADPEMEGEDKETEAENADPADNEQEEASAEDGREPATPEEQQQYDEFVAQALDLIAKPESKELRAKLLKLLGAGGDHVESLASTVYYVFSAVFKSGVEAGKQFDPGVLLAAGEEITQHIATFAKVRKVADYSEDEINAAFLKAVDTFRMNNKDMLDPEGAKQDLQELQSADEQGNLDQVAPGLAGALEKLKGLGSQQGAAPPGAAPAAPAPQGAPVGGE